ncbi:MAG TPA: toll/interleukin-1 receptor domain-containing protein, partial [Ktedonobacteraceae bacterium]|nr:toll/interleukin-1 receptor domain-containing protein [Ktedonobacteraceae bacterium]
MNAKHVQLLNCGVDVWNAWRQKYPEVEPDFRGLFCISAKLSSANLSNANFLGAMMLQTDLSGANLSNAVFQRAELFGANLSGAILSNAYFNSAGLIAANLSAANCDHTHFGFTNLMGANLSNADLSYADLNHANLSDAVLKSTKFHATHLSHTVLAGVDLCNVEELNTIVHEAPSIVDINTVQLPQGETLKSFLRGVGFSDPLIDNLSTLLTAAIRYPSCFISYAHQDEVLAQRLYKNLQDKGIRCWFAPEDMKTGDKIRARIDEAIHVHEKLLLLLSERAIESNWVEDEVEAALEKEKHQQREVL